MQDTWLPQPDLAEVEIGLVLQALADPVRLQIVRLLDAAGEGSCTSLDVPVKRSTVSHHLRTLRESGVVATRLVGNSRLSRLRRDDLESRFPGLLTSVLAADPPAVRPLAG
ncbi:ArsR/SmtB family transcription factor [Kitasatospora sp. NBC_00315]|uniref:ArsR/SmtB family transcription factor n=1 Tax=Kitasatospora sp. NBC_00315 TaxID=2975963 RepID=UPI0032569297